MVASGIPVASHYHTLSRVLVLQDNLQKWAYVPSFTVWPATRPVGGGRKLNSGCKAYQFGKRSTTEVKNTKFHINRCKFHETKESII
jgi:hypothetical protein